MKKIILFLALVIIATACGSNVDYFPKPRTYPRVDYPEKTYKAFDENYCAFTFQQPVYTEVIQDAEFFGEEAENPCWFDLYYPQFNGKLHCNYVEIDNNKNTLTKLVDDSYKLAFKHVSKASGIGEEGIYFPDRKVYGIFFPLEGSVASPYQFFVTDSVKHYMRGSLYFRSSPNPDSMAPVIEFVKQDIEKMLETFEWN